jgi:hypothetical protein
VTTQKHTPAWPWVCAGYHALVAAFSEVLGKPCEPFSITGSLPCIRELQEEGFDVQVSESAMGIILAAILLAVQATVMSVLSLR